MKLIADCGSTKIQWCAVENGKVVKEVFTPGMNAVMLTEEEMAARIGNELKPEVEGMTFESIYFYGAGCINEDVCGNVRRAIAAHVPAPVIEVYTDLLAAARALFGREAGIACIMGTGSNSCQWDGEKIVKQVRSGGFIIGDDGSASVLGKLFISDFIKGLVPEEIAAEYAETFPHEYPDIVEMIYHNPGSPSGWLGSLCPFIMSHYSNPYIKQMVDNNFRAFVERSLKQYEIDRYPVGVIGGFGNALKDIIKPIFEENGIRIRNFIPSPIEELIKYHHQTTR